MDIYQATRDFIMTKYQIDLDTLEPDFRLSDGNTKLKKDGIWSFNLIPIVHCPMAGACKSYCYATVGQQAFRSGVLRRARAFLATLSPDFVSSMASEILKAQKKGMRAIRIHDSGDFYSPEYFMKWVQLAGMFPGIRFYAYTKMIFFVQRFGKKLPTNLRLIQSLGGVADDRIDQSLPHSRIFGSLDELLAAGYMDASESDAPAAFGDSPLIGLVIHGAKSKRFDPSAMKKGAVA